MGRLLYTRRAERRLRDPDAPPEPHEVDLLATQQVVHRRPPDADVGAEFVWRQVLRQLLERCRPTDPAGRDVYVLGCCTHFTTVLWNAITSATAAESCSSSRGLMLMPLPFDG